MRKALFSFALAAAFAAGAHPHSALANDGPTQIGVVPEDGSDSPDDGPKPCALGTKIECGTLTIQTCTNWIYQPNFSIGTTSGGGGYTLVCGTWVTKVVKLYKD